MLFKNAEVFIDGRFKRLDMVVDGSYIVALGTDLAQANDSVDCSNLKILPGLFDIHTHGCLSYDFTLSSCEEIERMCRFYASHGVTSILATTMTNEATKYKHSMRTLQEVISKQRSNPDFTAKIQGIHMEGPFFGTSKKGAHDEHYLQSISQELFDEYQWLSGDNVLLLALDPTLDKAIEFIQANKDRVTIALGHTSCNYETALEAIAAGATHVTHLFNAMLPMHHREPGLIGAAIECNLNCELICDGIHVHKAVVHHMFKAMAEQMILISDSINPTGLADGCYTAGGLPIEVREQRAFLSDGTLAGSTITLYDAMKNAIEFGVEPEKAILSATYIPAKAVGIADRVGLIEVGRVADFLLVNEKFELVKVYVNGKEYL